VKNAMPTETDGSGASDAEKNNILSQKSYYLIMAPEDCAYRYPAIED
jgi:hypothetical protein